MSLHIPLITDWLGPNQRLRVDVGQTGFFAGREFRTFKEFISLGAGAEYVIKAVVPVNIILFGLELTIDDGQVRVGTYAGGTEGGTFSETLPRFSTNTMTEKPQPPYTPQVVLTAGGTHLGGIELDVIRLKTVGATGQAISVGNAVSDERGVIAGTYYFRLHNYGSGPTTGVFKARWEERP